MKNNDVGTVILMILLFPFAVLRAILKKSKY